MLDDITQKQGRARRASRSTLTAKMLDPIIMVKVRDKETDDVSDDTWSH